jgi:hypothetical protein
MAVKFPNMKLVRERCKQLAIDSIGELEADVSQLTETAIWQLPAIQRQKLREAQEFGPRIHLRLLFAPLGESFIPTNFNLQMMSRAIADLEAERLIICERDGRGRATHAKLTSKGREQAN